MYIFKLKEHTNMQICGHDNDRSMRCDSRVSVCALASKRMCEWGRESCNQSEMQQL